MINLPLEKIFGERVVFEQETQHHYIRVTQKGALRTLYFRKGPGAAKQSSIHIRHRFRLELEYTRMAFIGLAYVEQPKRVLVVGLGGGLIPMVLRHHFPKMAIDVIDIDPAIVKVAKDYFFFSTKPPTRAIVSDGRFFVRRAGAGGWKYDMIVLDAYTSEYIPAHMMTKEFLLQVRRIVAPGGCIVSNIHASNMLYDYEQRTYAAVFPQNQTFLGRKSSNALVVSRMDGDPVPMEVIETRAEALQKAHGFVFDLTTIVPMFLKEPNWVADGDILTDDFSPANLLRVRPR